MMASSMTMPTASVKASSVMLFSEKSIPRISVNVAMTDAGLAKHLYGNHILRRRIFSEQCGPGAKFLRSVFHLSNVPHAHRSAAARANYDFAELFRGSHAAQRAQAQFLRAGNHAAAGSLDVLPLQGCAHVQHGNIVRSQLLRIEQNADLPALPAVQ